MTSRRVVMATLALALSLGAGACASGDDGPPLSGAQADDPVLQLGRTVFQARCARCHGETGGGGAGPKLAGSVRKKYADAAAVAEVVRGGRGAMPSWKNVLTADEINAVARYVREVL